MIGNGRPTEVDRNLRDILFHNPRPFARLRRRNHRRSHDHGLALNKRPWCLDIHVNTDIALQAKSLHWLATLRAHLVVTWPLVHDSRVVVSDVGDVGGLIDNGHIAFRRNHRGLDPLRTEFSRRDKTILVGADVVIVIRPIVDAGALIESRLRRQRRPADVIVALSPGNPGRRPFITRHPNPADAAQPRPASVVIGGPTKPLFGNPGPAGIGVNPAPVCVRSPVSRSFCFAGLPDVAVITRLKPRAVWIKLGIES